METDRLKRLYESRYAGKMRFLTSRPGVHSVIVDIAKPFLDGATVLDVGCGAGRLSLMCARWADRVFGLDRAQGAVELAELAARATRTRNVHFEARDSDDLPDQKFDMVMLSEVIEHLENPAGTLHRLYRRLKKGGILVVSCPSFLNFRGYLWMVLQEVFGLCMSPSDIRQVYPHDVEKWAAATGFSVELEAGLYYDWAWTGEAVADMKRRIRLALGDKKKENPKWAAIALHMTALDRYLDSQIEYHRGLISAWVSGGDLTLTGDWPIPVTASDVLADTPGLLEEMKTYLKDRQIHYAKEAPVNRMGAGAAYLLRRQ